MLTPRAFLAILTLVQIVLIVALYSAGYLACWQRDRPIIARANAEIRSMRAAIKLPKPPPGPLSTPSHF